MTITITLSDGIQTYEINPEFISIMEINNDGYTKIYSSDIKQFIFVRESIAQIMDLYSKAKTQHKNDNEPKVTVHNDMETVTIPIKNIGKLRRLKTKASIMKKRSYTEYFVDETFNEILDMMAKCPCDEARMLTLHRMNGSGYKNEEWEISFDDIEELYVAGGGTTYVRIIPPPDVWKPFTLWQVKDTITSIFQQYIDNCKKYSEQEGIEEIG